MMKKVFLILVLLIPIWMFAQDIPFEVSGKTRYSQSSMYGNVQIDSLKFKQMRFIQEFKVWKIVVGLDLDFLFDKNNHLRPNNWDHWEDVLSKFYYLKYAQRGDPWYFHVGGFPSLTLGYGLIMSNYSNMQLYPEMTNTGLMVGCNPRWPTDPSFEVFSSNVSKNQILSLRAHCKPLPDSTLRVLDKMIVGMSLVTDLNQHGNLRQLTPDSLSYLLDGLKWDTVMAAGFGYTLPVYQHKKLSISNYAEVAHIAGNGTGCILPGVSTTFGNLTVNLEYRMYGNKFMPAFFDRYYEETRAIAVNDSLGVVTKEDTLEDVKGTFGWNGSVSMLWFHRVKTSFAWQNVFGKELKTGKSIWANLWVDTKYKRLENITINYSKTGTETMAISRINEPNAEIGGSTTIRVYKKNLYFIAKYSEKYIDKNGNGKVNWAKETKRSWGVGVKYLVK